MSVRTYEIEDFVTPEQHTYIMLKYGSLENLANAFVDTLSPLNRIAFSIMQDHEQAELLAEFFNREIE